MRNRTELGRLVRFGMVGAAATAAHALAYLALVIFTAVAPSLANLIAYVVALTVSLVGHTRITFGVALSLGPAAKVLASSLLSLALNAAFVWLVTALDYPPELAVLFFVAVTPAVTYIVMRTLLLQS